MKTRLFKRMALTGLMITALLLLAPGALANSWGLKNGKLLDMVSRVNTWDDYSTLCDEAGDYALMGARYHNALFYVGKNGTLSVYTKAVYQPEDKAKSPALLLKNGRLTLQYGKNERYVFEDVLKEGALSLTEAHIGAFRLTLDLAENEHGYAYRAEQGQEKALLIQRITLPDFNIRLLPRSVKEVLHLNYMQARVNSGLFCLGTTAEGYTYSPDHWGIRLSNSKTGTIPVYSAPFQDAWRAAGGKAAVGLNGDVWHLFSYKNPDGQSYACIRYFVSPRTQRIGYVRREDAGLPAIQGEQDTQPGSSFTYLTAETQRKTFLTDDPDVSQFKLFELKKGTPLVVLGLYNNDYAYVKMENFADKTGKTIQTLWGFVPIRDIKTEALPLQRETMKKLYGSWAFNAGGNMADDVLTFRPDGTFNDGGTWYVTAYDAKMNLYWNVPPYELTLLYKDGRAIVRGLAFDKEGFSLTYWEGGGGYVPTDTPYREAEHG